MHEVAAVQPCLDDLAYLASLTLTGIAALTLNSRVCVWLSACDFCGAVDGVSSAPDTQTGGRQLKMSDPSAPSELEKRSTETTASQPLKFSALRLTLAFVIAGASDLIGAFTSLAPPIGWAVDVVTAALLFVVLGWQWLLLPGLVLEAIPGVGVLPFWLLVVGAIAVLGTPRPKIGQQ